MGPRKSHILGDYFYGTSWAVVKAKAYQGHRDMLIALAASDEFRDAAQDHIQRYGAAAHVLKLVQQFDSRLKSTGARARQVARAARQAMC